MPLVSTLRTCLTNQISYASNFTVAKVANLSHDKNSVKRIEFLFEILFLVPKCHPRNEIHYFSLICSL